MSNAYEIMEGRLQAWLGYSHGGRWYLVLEEESDAGHDVRVSFDCESYEHVGHTLAWLGGNIAEAFRDVGAPAFSGCERRARTRLDIHQEVVEAWVESDPKYDSIDLTLDGVPWDAGVVGELGSGPGVAPDPDYTVIRLAI